MAYMAGIPGILELRILFPQGCDTMVVKRLYAMYRGDLLE
jgi:hypothetical protein